MEYPIKINSETGYPDNVIIKTALVEREDGTVKQEVTISDRELTEKFQNQVIAAILLTIVLLIVVAVILRSKKIHNGFSVLFGVPAMIGLYTTFFTLPVPGGVISPFWKTATQKIQ